MTVGAWGCPTYCGLEFIRLGVVRVLAWKLRICVLWISLAACQGASVTLVLSDPALLRDLLAGEGAAAGLGSPGDQVLTALYWLGPMAFAYLSLVLQDDTNRRTNALLAGGGALYGASELITPPNPSVGNYFVGVAALLIQLLIVWHVWKWPRVSEVTNAEHSEDAKPR